MSLLFTIWLYEHAEVPTLLVNSFKVKRKLICTPEDEDIIILLSIESGEYIEMSFYYLYVILSYSGLCVSYDGNISHQK